MRRMVRRMPEVEVTEAAEIDDDKKFSTFLNVNCDGSKTGRKSRKMDDGCLMRRK